MKWVVKWGSSSGGYGVISEHRGCDGAGGYGHTAKSIRGSKLSSVAFLDTTAAHVAYNWRKSALVKVIVRAGGNISARPAACDRRYGVGAKQHAQRLGAVIAVVWPW